MIYWIVATLYLFIVVFSFRLGFVYLLRMNANMIYLSRSLLVLPFFMIIVSCIVALAGLRYEQVVLYDSNTVLISTIFCLSFLIVGSISVYVMTKWKVIFEESHFEYSSYRMSKKVIRHESIEYIDAFRPSSNGIIHIVTKDDLIKINHNFIMGDIGSLTKLVSKYRKKN